MPLAKNAKVAKENENGRNAEWGVSTSFFATFAAFARGIFCALCYAGGLKVTVMAHERIAGFEDDDPRADPPLTGDIAPPTARDGVSDATAEKAERATEKIFRLHARLFVELAK